MSPLYENRCLIVGLVQMKPSTAPPDGIWPCGKLRVVALRTAYLPSVSPALALAGCGGGQARSAAPSHGQVSRGVQGFTAAAGRAARAGQPAAGRREHGVSGPPEQPPRLPGGGQQVGSVVRSLPAEFPVFQRCRWRSGAGWRSWASTARTPPAGGRLPAPVPGQLPELRRPDENIARAIQAATYFPQTVFFDRSGHEVYRPRRART